MSHLNPLTSVKSFEEHFRLNPLAAAVRIIITSGLLVGSGVTPVLADHHPLPVLDLVPSYTTTPTDIISDATHGHATANLDVKDATNHTLDITQNPNDNKIVIDWSSFDVDKGYKVNFIQEHTSDVALNNIHQGDPSQIMGSISANGQVYLFNQNGFIFGKDSVVDANTLVATALNISDDAFKNGIIRVFDNNTDINKRAALNGVTGDSKTAVNLNAAITVAAGAKIHVNKNGSLLLTAPTVNNSGSLTADQHGQIMMVASQDKVYLQPTSSKDPFAGLIVEVGTGGNVNNTATGNIDVREGNITLAGFAINQSGQLSATTSVDINGSIRLLAREGATNSFDPKTNRNNLVASQTVRTDGTKSSVTFGDDTGSNNTTTVLADKEGGTAIDEQEQKKSLVEVSAQTIEMKANSSIVATGGTVNFTTSNNLLDAAGTPIQGNTGSIILDSGAKIDVSGTKNIDVPMERNVAEISVQTFNLRDAPYQKGGILQGAKVNVDIRNLPSIIDASSASSGINRSVAERLTTGGTINLTSAGNVSIKNGAITDISGGNVNYQSGYLSTSQLVTADTGQVVDIYNANPSLKYSSIFGIVVEPHSAWGADEKVTYTSPLVEHYEQGYVDGKAAGTIDIQSVTAEFAGQVVAGSQTGLHQLNSPVSGGTLAFNPFDNGGATNQANVFLSNQNVSIISDNETVANTNLVLSSNMLNQAKLSNLIIKTSGAVVLDKNANLMLPEQSKVSLDASNINISGSIYSAGGTINLNGLNTGIDNTGLVNINSGSILDVSGRWINQFMGDVSSPVIINAGSVNVSANNRLNFANNAQIKADGGALADIRGRVNSFGNAGTISLTAGSKDFDGLLVAEGNLSAFGLSQGGSLTLASNKINIGNTVPEANALNLDVINTGVHKGTLALVENSGFSSISLISNQQNVTLSANTNLSLNAFNREITSNYLNVASTNNIKQVTQDLQAQLPDGLIKPVQLSLNGLSGVMLDTGSSIAVDKRSTINIIGGNAGSGIYIDGNITALGGNINLHLTADLNSLPYNGSQSIWLGSNALLDVHGVTQTFIDNTQNVVTGNVLNGGNVSIIADRGYVVIEKGTPKEDTKINISGSSDLINIPSSMSFGYNQKVIGSDAGKLNITAAEGIVFDGNLKANAGSASNLGGSLSLTLDRNQRKEQLGAVFPIQAPQFNITNANDIQLPKGAGFGNISSELNGLATISTEKITNAGFSQLSINVPFQFDSNGGPIRAPGIINFEGQANLTTNSNIVLDAQTIGWSSSSDTAQTEVSINTPYLVLGSSSYNKIIGNSVLGSGHLTTNTQWTQLNSALLLTGFSTISLNSVHDLRTVGMQASDSERIYTGNLVTTADLNITASQFYPTTFTDYTVNLISPNSQLTVTGTNKEVSPLSAAGKLNLIADTINQNGVIKAPLGSIVLTATKAITFGKDSLTSVSANGQTIPFGTIVNNSWEYPLGFYDNVLFNQSLFNATTKQYELLSVGEKHLVINAPDIEFKKGSQTDLSGGGDLLAYQFQPGLGGSFDYILPGSPSYQGGFAILPSLGSSLAPFDPYYSSSNTSDPRNSVYLSGTADLPAGFYTILPSRYAILPGAYLITPQANTQDQTLLTYAVNGLPIVSGYQLLAGTNTNASRTMGYLVESNADIKKHSEYNIQTANSFFANQANKNNTNIPLLPQDSGQVSIDASTRLILEGQFNVLAQKGARGAKMDISAKNIQVVSHLSVQPTSGTLELLDNNLSQLHVDSLLLGGTRSTENSTGITNVNVTADSVKFADNTKVEALDLMAIAKSTIEAGNSVNITSSGSVNTGQSILKIANDSALLRISADSQVTVEHASGKSAGAIVINEGANLSASKSMILDASSTVLKGNINMHGGSLSLSANVINLGDIPVDLVGDALNLSNKQLTQITVDDLILNSNTSVNIYGNLGQIDAQNKLLLDSNKNAIPLVFNNLFINASGLSGYSQTGQSANLKATHLVLENSNLSTSTLRGIGTGSLNLVASNYTQGSGAFSIDGFNQVNEMINNGFIIDGNSNVKVSGDVNLTTAYISETAGSGLKYDDSGYNLNINGNSTPINATSDVYGGSMSFVGNSILMNTHVIMPSGNLTLKALTGDVQLGANAGIDLAGRSTNFADKVTYTKGGSFSVDSNQGDIKFESGSKIDISSGNTSAAGGNLNLNAHIGSVTLDGVLVANGSSASIDVANFNSDTTFDKLVTAINLGNINNSIYIRDRLSDINVGSDTRIKANKIDLVADKGVIDVNGQLIVDQVSHGGSISLYSGAKITLESGSVLSAKGSQYGGKVLLSSINYDLPAKSQIELKQGSLINVSASAGNGGTVTLSTVRNDVNGINLVGLSNNSIAGKVLGANSFYAEGFEQYKTSNIDDGVVTQLNSDINSYMSNNNVLNSIAHYGQNIKLKPAVEIDSIVSPNSIGDLTVSTSTAWDFSKLSQPGTGASIIGDLLLRSAGQLLVNNSLTDGFALNSDGSMDALNNGESWSFKLVSGADITSADNLATSNAKDLIIGTGASVHTGSGDINIVSGGDLVFADQTSTIFSAGRSEMTNPYGSISTVKHPTGEYPIAGGDLIINAKGNITGHVSNQFIDAWLTRQGTKVSQRASTNSLTAWAVNASNFQQNVGSFGGGAVDITSSGNINDLSVMLPTTGKQMGSMEKTVDNTYIPHNQIIVSGGGALNVNAGGDIKGGAFFLGKGNGTINADGVISGSTNTDLNAFTSGPQLVLSGDQNDPVNGDANLSLNAGTGIQISAVSDAMVLHKDGPEFFTYTDKSTLSVSTLSGDIHLNADTHVITNILGISNPNEQQLTLVYPASVNTTAFGGSVKIDSNIILYPSAISNINIFAKNDITSTNGQNSIIMSDASLSSLPNSYSTINSDGDQKLLDAAAIFDANAINSSGIPGISKGGTSPLIHANTPIHNRDTQPARIVTQQGDIANFQMILPKLALIQAGKDLTNSPLQIQQINSSDASIISAGRDISFVTDLDVNGVPTNKNALYQILINGSGETLVKTGRNLDLGASSGLTSVGNIYNSALSSTGASLNVMVGLNGGSPDYVKFLTTNAGQSTFANESLASAQTIIFKYVNDIAKNPDAYKTQIISFMNNMLFSSRKVEEGYLAQTNLSLTSSEGDKVAAFLGLINKHDDIKLAFFDGLPSSLTVEVQLQLNMLLSYVDTTNLHGMSQQEIKSLNDAKDLIYQFMKDRTGDGGLSLNQALTEFAKLASDDTITIQTQLNNLLSPVLLAQTQNINSLPKLESDRVALRNASQDILDNYYAPTPDLSSQDTKTLQDFIIKTANGFVATDAFFPKGAAQGDLSMFFSKIQTVEGGDINLYTPTGQINVGLAVAPSGSGAKGADQLGIVAQTQGQINVIANNDVNVNTSRIFTIGGGDINLWSSFGNIDAGKGAKSALAVTIDPPYYDQNNQLVIPAPKITSGSGIRAAAPSGIIPGNVNPIAPNGKVDAGEAGIAGTGINLITPLVANAAQIQAGAGGVTGAPAAPANNSAALSSASNASASATQTAQSTMDEDDNKKKKKDTVLGMLSVDILGFGD